MTSMTSSLCPRPRLSGAVTAGAEAAPAEPDGHGAKLGVSAAVGVGRSARGGRPRRSPGQAGGAAFTRVGHNAHEGAELAGVAGHA